MSRLYLFVLFVFATTAVAQSQQAQIVPLPDASWRYHYGDDPRCATLSGDGCTVAPGDSQNLAFAPIVWGRTVVGLPDSLRAPQELGVLIEGAPCIYEVFVNGHLIGSHGDLKTIRAPFDSRAIFPFSSALAQDGRVAISIRTNTAIVNLSGDFKPLDSSVGPLALVRENLVEHTISHFRQHWQHYLCFLIVFCIGLFFLLLYALDPSSEEHLWLALILCMVSSLRLMELGSFVDLGLNSLPADVFTCLEGFADTVCIVQFGFSMIRRKVWTPFRIVQFAGAFDLVHLCVYLPLAGNMRDGFYHFDSLTTWIFTLLLLVSAFAYLVPVRSCFRDPLPEMRWIGAALLFLWFEDFNRYLTYLSVPGVPHISGVPQNMPVGGLDLDLRGLAYLLFAVVMLVAMTVRFRRLQTRNRQVELDLEAARTVQRLLIPAEAPMTPAFKIESFYLPAQEVGGDFFHVAPAPDNSVLVVVGDVSGKGLSAAMTVSTIIGALRTNSVREPSVVLMQLNRALHGFVSGFATCCVALLTPDGQLTVANAGHLNPYRNGTELSVSGSLPLGLSADAEYTSEHFNLNAGDHLTFISDGVVESTGLKGELFGFERTAALSRESAQAIASAAQSFGAGAQADDITVLTLDVTG